jgi:DUF4097 and DUF4098 domain-containing protein YvlB
MATVRIFSGSHRCEITAGDVESVTVDGKANIEQGPDSFTIDKVRSRLEVSVPAGTDLVVGSSSGRIDVRGPLGSVSATSNSGKIVVESADAVDARTASSRIEIGEVSGQCRINTASGRVEVYRCGSADIATASSRIDLKSVGGPARAHTVSGRVEVMMDVAADVDAETVTGRVEVSLPKGTVVHRPEPGNDTARPSDADCTVLARSTTGRVEVTTR